MRRAILTAVLVLIAVLFQRPIVSLGQQTSSADAFPPDSIKWYDYNTGVSVAQQTGRPIILWFYGSWCPHCKHMTSVTWCDSTIARYLSDYFTPIRIETQSRKKISVDGVQMTEAQFATTKFGVRAVPSLWIVEPGGCRIAHLIGFRPVKNLLPKLDEIKDCQYGDCTNVPLNQ